MIDMIETVDRKFTKRISSIASLSYPARLAILDLNLLEQRRLRFDLIGYFKVFNHLTPSYPTEVVIICALQIRTEENNPRLER
jgi:hypothetical protein